MRCAVAGCHTDYQSKNYTSDLMFFRFPKDENLSSTWVNACKRDVKFKVKNARICSKHFDKDCYERNLKFQLLGYSARNRRCTWKFLNHHVYPCRQYYLTIKGLYVECDASLYAYNSGGPIENKLNITVKISNIHQELHIGSKKRKLTGENRVELGKVLYDGKLAVKYWIREEANKVTKHDQLIEHSTLYTLPVLRKCKQEYGDKKCKVLPQTKDPISNLLHTTIPCSYSFHWCRYIFSSLLDS
ncbi:hypothetical protein RI129_002873 [Pyrocoelia pectoralis]|uniref:THAP-type domain-containing protein n=1 Tax=Pyrocoelia pectoralis TaxID=417401 RepID=A0AAN7VMQ6_9COLE